MGDGVLTMRPALLVAALLLTGCTHTALLPNVQTGKCYAMSYTPPFGWGYALADAIDGWRCEGLKEGDVARTGDRSDSPAPPAKAATAPAAPARSIGPAAEPPIPGAPSSKPLTAEPTWATGE